MITLAINENGHAWEKQNLVTLPSKKGGYDLYKCKNCGLTGKSYRLGTVEIENRHYAKAMSCPNAHRGKTIRIVRCNAVGEEFNVLIPGSLHEIVSAPKGQNNKRGEWVMGKTEPVLLLFGEFEYVD